MKYLISALFAYVVAAPLTDLISLDLRLTEWSNLMTYVFWAFGTAIWSIGVFSIIAMFALFVTVFERR